MKKNNFDFKIVITNKNKIVIAETQERNYIGMLLEVFNNYHPSEVFITRYNDGEKLATDPISGEEFSSTLIDSVMSDTFEDVCTDEASNGIGEALDQASAKGIDITLADKLLCNLTVGLDLSRAAVNNQKKITDAFKDILISAGFTNKDVKVFFKSIVDDELEGSRNIEQLIKERLTDPSKIH